MPEQGKTFDDFDQTNRNLFDRMKKWDAYLKADEAGRKGYDVSAYSDDDITSIIGLKDMLGDSWDRELKGTIDAIKSGTANLTDKQKAILQAMRIGQSAEATAAAKAEADAKKAEADGRAAATALGSNYDSLLKYGFKYDPTSGRFKMVDRDAFGLGDGDMWFNDMFKSSGSNAGGAYDFLHGKMLLGDLLYNQDDTAVDPIIRRQGGFWDHNATGDYAGADSIIKSL